MSQEVDVSANWQDINERCSRALDRAGRGQDEGVTVVAVTKTVPVEVIRKAVAAGVRILGENRVQEASDKFGQVENVTWHMIGHLQRNKVKAAVEMFSMIHSLDSVRLAREVEKHASAINKVIDVLVQVNAAAEDTKYGIPPKDLEEFLVDVSQMPHLRVRGLMTIAPLVDDPNKVRPVFAQLKSLQQKAQELCIPGVSMEYLSMGMSSDFEVAIEEGANIVRIGSALFGPRR